MDIKPRLEPSARHPITLEPNPKRVVVRVGKHVVADTRDAITLREAKYQLVQYIPMADVDEEVLVRTDHTSYCPFKGDATYFSVSIASARAENAVWEYLDPFPAVAAIKGRVAFYPDRVDAISELDD
jgi:uncharacterized protein (DUF427 family)